MDFGTLLSDYGLAGMIIFAEAIVVITLYNSNEKKNLRIEELQDLRLADSKQVTKDVTTVMQDSSQNIRILSEKIEVARNIRQ